MVNLHVDEMMDRRRVPACGSVCMGLSSAKKGGNRAAQVSKILIFLWHCCRKLFSMVAVDARVGYFLNRNSSSSRRKERKKAASMVTIRRANFKATGTWDIHLLMSQACRGRWRKVIRNKWDNHNNNNNNHIPYKHTDREQDDIQ